MKRLNINLKKIAIFGAVLISRFGFLPPNFSMLPTYGFFEKNVALYALNIVLFDLIRSGFRGFGYRGFYFTYLGFAVYYLVGFYFRKKRQKQTIIHLLLASVGFYLVSNFGVWLFWYQHSWQSLLKCYVVALPFFQRTILSNVFFYYLVKFVKEFNQMKAKEKIREIIAGSVA